MAEERKDGTKLNFSKLKIIALKIGKSSGKRAEKENSRRKNKIKTNKPKNFFFAKLSFFSKKKNIIKNKINGIKTTAKPLLSE